MLHNQCLRTAVQRAACCLSLVVPALLGCASAGNAGAPVRGDAGVVSSQPTRGGVRYDPALPLDAQATAKFDTASPPPSGLTWAVRYKGGDGATVPGLFMSPGAKVTGAPCVVLLHGVGGRKEDIFLLQIGLAQRGYASFAIDIAGHGERPRIGGKPVFELTLPEMRQLAGQTIADLRRGVDYLHTRPEVDKERIGFVGISLGGILGAVFAADEPRVKTSVLWAAGADWGKLITTSTHDFAKRARQARTMLPSEIAREMADVDPLSAAGNIAPRPLLLINGDKDTVVPTVCTDELYTAAREPKKRITLPGGHIPDIMTMAAETLNWLDSHLKATKVARP